VARVVLLDAILPGPVGSGAARGDGPGMAGAPHSDAEWLAATARTLERYFGRSPGALHAGLDHRTPEEAMEMLLERMARLDLVPAAAGRPLLESMVAAQRASERMAGRYRPHRHDGPVTLIRARDLHPEDARRIPPSLLADAALGWGAFVSGPLDVETVGGDHLAMLTEPHVAELARVLRAALDLEAESALDSAAAGA
jgi:thioesterase domain-containing protein